MPRDILSCVNAACEILLAAGKPHQRNMSHTQPRSGMWWEHGKQVTFNKLDCRHKI